MGFSSGTSTKWLFVLSFQIEVGIWQCWFLQREENGEDAAKNPWRRDDNQQQT